jgi:hypothetical protein
MTVDDRQPDISIERGRFDRLPAVFALEIRHSPPSAERVAKQQSATGRSKAQPCRLVWPVAGRIAPRASASAPAPGSAARRHWRPAFRDRHDAKEFRRKMTLLLPKPRPKAIQCSTRWTSMLGRGDGGKSVTPLQSIVLGVTIVWIPSLLLLAIFLWRAPVVRETHASDQELSRERIAKSATRGH